jgi:hypothetical protein
MLNLTSLALGLLTIIAFLPASEAAININPLSIQKPATNLHSQVILKIGQPGYSRRSEAQRRRDLQLQRERAAELRRRKYRGNYDKYDRNDRRQNR